MPARSCTIHRKSDRTLGGLARDDGVIAHCAADGLVELGPVGRPTPCQIGRGLRKARRAEVGAVDLDARASSRAAAARAHASDGGDRGFWRRRGSAAQLHRCAPRRMCHVRFAPMPAGAAAARWCFDANGAVRRGEFALRSRPSRRSRSAKRTRASRSGTRGWCRTAKRAPHRASQTNGDHARPLRGLHLVERCVIDVVHGEYHRRIGVYGAPASLADPARSCNGVAIAPLVVERGDETKLPRERHQPQSLRALVVSVAAFGGDAQKGRTKRSHLVCQGTARLRQSQRRRSHSRPRRVTCH